MQKRRNSSALANTEYGKRIPHLDELMQKRRNSSALAMEL